MNTIILVSALISIYFGYRLFCGISRGSGQLVAGALLAMFGASVLVAEARAFTVHGSRPGSGNHRPTNWHNGAAPSSHRRPHVELIA
jgi:hypothetical protein